ncbi:TOPLESS-RELATED PROTEIN 1-RELATED [Salix purpurea]|uniref:TOPLESS-RELATED PROTEIN 1-RELATED n=1 Tax=Salix purpurea TaxID=77065 RepID=A0A9Q0T223_SALPP|nr:TOPLESS-RELATED PROTEIN 1-RELATED [Salix purpurea]
MTNDLTGSSPEKTVPCFAVSKNDSCLLSASGGRISLYSLLEFKIFVRKVEGWGKERSRFLSIHDGRTLSSLSLDTDIQSHQNRTEFLAWSPGDFGAPISHATFSFDGQMVHASFEDGVVSIFDASAQMYCFAFIPVHRQQWQIIGQCCSATTIPHPC